MPPIVPRLTSNVDVRYFDAVTEKTNSTSSIGQIKPWKQSNRLSVSPLSEQHKINKTNKCFSVDERNNNTMITTSSENDWESYF